jgi:hypothetical protein
MKGRNFRVVKVNENPRKFLFRTSNGSYIKIKAEKDGIVITKSYKDDRWSSPFLLENMHPSFFAEMDSLDNVHILAQDFKGNIYYYKSDKSVFSKYPLLKSSERSAFDRNFFMLLNREEPIFFYTIHRDNGSVLVYQSFVKNKAGTPMPVSMVPATHCPFWISSPKSRTALILCPRVSGMYVQIHAAKLRLDTMAFSSFVRLTNEEADCESPRCITLPDGAIHMLYSTRKNGKSYIKYGKIKESTLESGGSEIIASSSYPFRRYNIEYSSDKIYINWTEDRYVYFKEKHLSEPEFSKARLFKAPRMNHIEYFFYNSNTRQEKGNIYSTEQPLSIDEKVLHAFYREGSFEAKKADSKAIKEDTNGTLFNNDAIISAIASIFLSKAELNKSRMKEAEKVVDFISQLSKAFADEEKKKAEGPEKKSYKLGKTEGYHRYKAVRD